MSGSSAPAAISIRQTTPTMKWLGKTCPKCQKEIAVGDQVVLCPKCFTPQHAQCWRDNGNQCAVDQTPARIIEPRGRPAGAAAPAAEGASAPAAAAPAPAAAAPRPAAAAAPAAAAPAPAPVASTTQLANPWRDARVVEAPPTSDLWRRNIMTIFAIIVLWAIAMLVYAILTQFGVGTPPA